jgi:hypothetical protein
MLALMRDVRTGEPRALHRTALAPDGAGNKGKAVLPDNSSPKKILGPRAACAIMLSASEDITYGLGICEGIETGASIIARFGWRPVWACGDAGGIRTFPRLAGLDCLTIFADHDEAHYRPSGEVYYPGQDAAKACMARLVGEGLPEVIYCLPPIAGADWNDMAARAAA